MHKLIEDNHPSQTPSDARTRQLWNKLKQKLLEFGGKRAVWRAPEPHLQELLTQFTIDGSGHSGAHGEVQKTKMIGKGGAITRR